MATLKNDHNSSFSYLTVRYNITEQQFKNLITFLTVILNENVTVLINMSPAYLLEKFSRYIGNTTIINTTDEYEHGGVHPVLREQFLERYYELWGNIEHWEFMVEETITCDNFVDDN